MLKKLNPMFKNAAACISMVFCLFPFCQDKAFAQGNSMGNANIVLQGELGKVETMATGRLFKAPFTSVEWLRADLTNETVGKDDKNEQSVWKRPFKYFSGDISGRYIELMAVLSKGDLKYHPALKQFIAELPSRQKSDGHFGWADIDWNIPIDFSSDGLAPSLMMPALWGNGRMLCGLVNSYKAFKQPQLLTAAKRLGDFYINTANRFMDPNKLAEYNSGGSYASGYVTCYFNGLEGLMKLYQTTRDDKYLAVAARMAAFLVQFDHLPIDHAHGMLCNQNALLLLYEETGQKMYLGRVEKRWTDLVDNGYIDPAGGILEEAKIGYARDEGCAETDWLRLNLELFKITGHAKYLDMVDRLVNNHFIINQNASGGFGHRFILNDNTGVFGFAGYSQEATWCCDFHGTLGLLLFKSYVSAIDAAGLKINFALNYSATLPSKTNSFWKLQSEVLTPGDSGIIRKQVIRLSSNHKKDRIRMLFRLPDWAKSIDVTNAQGEKIKLRPANGYWRTENEIASGQTITVFYRGGIVLETRNCQPIKLAGNGVVNLGKVVLRDGPKVLMLANTAEIPVLSLKRNQQGEITIKGQNFTSSASQINQDKITPVTLAPRPVGDNTGKSVFVFDAILSDKN